MPKPLTVWITTNCGKFFKRQEYQTTLPASWWICMQVKKQQLEQDIEQWTDWKLEKEYVQAVYCHPAYLTSVQNASFSPAFCMMYSAYKLNKQGDNIQPWHTPFSIWNQSIVPCPCLTVASWPAFLRRQNKVVWYSHLFKNFQFVVIYTAKGFSVFNEAEVSASLEFSFFFYDPMDVSNLISGSSTFSKSSWNIWNFSSHTTEA